MAVDSADAYIFQVAVPAEHVLADRAYDADNLFDKILDQRGDVVIPPRRHRRFQHAYDMANRIPSDLEASVIPSEISWTGYFQGLGDFRCGNYPIGKVRVI